MNPEQDDDPILDACLAEVLGGHAPPDLTARIVGPGGQLIAKAAIPVLASITEPPPVVTVPPVIDVSTRSVTPQSVVQVKSLQRHDSWSIAAIVAVAAGFVGIVFAIGMVARLKSPRPQIAKVTAPAE